MVLLSIQNLQTLIEGKVVLQGVNLMVREGEVHALMGANGSGKTSFAQVLMGNAAHVVTHPSKKTILFDGQDLLSLTSDERSRAGLYVAWQAPIVIPGVSVFNLCKASYEATGHKIAKLTDFKHHLEVLAERVGLTKEHIGRSVNEGFSGGERKRLELLQLLLLQPKLAILDEIDSGLDGKGIAVVAQIIGEMKQAGVSFILITHNKRLLDEILIDFTWEMKRGKLSAGI